MDTLLDNTSYFENQDRLILLSYKKVKKFKDYFLRFADKSNSFNSYLYLDISKHKKKILDGFIKTKQTLLVKFTENLDITDITPLGNKIDVNFFSETYSGFILNPTKTIDQNFYDYALRYNSGRVDKNKKDELFFKQNVPFGEPISYSELKNLSKFIYEKNVCDCQDVGRRARGSCISYKNIHRGCHERVSLIISYFFKKNRFVSLKKIFVKGMLWYSNDSNGRPLFWEKHVAIVVDVKKDGRKKISPDNKETMIIDFSFGHLPVKLEDWIKDLSRNCCIPFKDRMPFSLAQCLFTETKHFNFSDPNELTQCKCIHIDQVKLDPHLITLPTSKKLIECYLDNQCNAHR